jgi:hypothetical protein
MPGNEAPLGWNSARLLKVHNQVPHTLCKIYYFALPAQFKVDLIVARGRMIHSFSQIHQRFHNLAREYEADPNT